MFRLIVALLRPMPRRRPDELTFAQGVALQMMARRPVSAYEIDAFKSTMRTLEGRRLIEPVTPGRPRYDRYDRYRITPAGRRVLAEHTGQVGASEDDLPPAPIRSTGYGDEDELVTPPLSWSTYRTAAVAVTFLAGLLLFDPTMLRLFDTLLG